ncbi:HIT domain-containing protein [Stenotrophobium rhamnosiphilum]|uniref:HIT family protein n=1 Tax=Stenotrophobium rhamnosiphilum TaxID=2029166 RepID=A0A2T5MFD2_9GAMM|nr:HIT domain-containing protein [Stenotrophobium rhamnosiphilum]PTU31291.1 HIT family protein [Stenotrophobium rhamnosiphilum]
MNFELHPQLAADTVLIGDLPLCRLLLMNDRQYPWTILVPRRAGLREIFQMHESDQLCFWRESAQLSQTLMTAFAGDKLNVAALGNMVPQLHIHHIVRFKGDPAWPAPVWGKHPAQPYDSAALNERLQQLRTLLNLEPSQLA